VTTGKAAHVRVTLVFCFILLAICASVLFFNKKTNSLARHVSPGLLCDDPQFDAGSLSAQQARQFAHSFALTNVSDRTIRVLDKSTNCGCTSAELAASDVQPGQTVRLTVTVDWGDRSGPQFAMARLKTDEPAAVDGTVISFKANVFNPVIVWPHNVDFLRLAPGLSDEQQFEVKQASADSRFLITEIQADSPDIQIRRITTQQEQGGLAGTPGVFGVRVMGKEKRTSAQSLIRVRTSLGTTYEVRVSTSSQGAIIASPESIVFRPGMKAAKIEVHIPSEPSGRKFQAILDQQPDKLAFALESVLPVPQSTTTHADRVFHVQLRSNQVSEPVSAASLHLIWGDAFLDVPVTEFTVPN
jgi:hypothetical protein